MVRWLVIGIGDIARRRVLPAILAEPRSLLAGIVTRNPSKAEAYRAPAWQSLKSALAESDADAVYIATPVFLHAPQTVQCLRAGRRVLCEKPMALNYDEACSMQQAAQETGQMLGVAYYRRLYPKVNRARELMEAGVIGRPFLAEATSHDWFSLGLGRDWLADPAQAGGGPLYDVASHRIDLMNYLFGKPLQATGYRSTLVQSVAVDDNATVLIEHAGGVRATVDVRWHSHVARDEFRIRGVDGEMDLSPLNGAHLSYPGGEENLPAHENLHYPCIADFVSAVLDGTPLRSSGASALETEWVMEQVGRPAHTNAGAPSSVFEAAADAVVAGDMPTLRKLLEERPELARQRSAREHRSTLLHYVAANGVEDFRQKTPANIVQIAGLLLDAGADVNAESGCYGGGSTPLGLVGTSVHPERAGVQNQLMQLLLDHGARIDAPSAAGKRHSIIEGCLWNGRGKAARYLASRGARLNLETAAGAGQLEAVKGFFDESGALHPTSTREQLQRGFLWASEYGHNDVVDFLLARGADLRDQAETRETALHWAVVGAQLSTVQLLLERGAPLEELNAYGGTVLGQALWSFLNGDSQAAYVPIFESLLAAGAKIEDGCLAWFGKQESRSAAERAPIAAVLRRYGAV
jgi:predicted dehydrogenase/ankyrin repeat protein